MTEKKRTVSMFKLASFLIFYFIRFTLTFALCVLLLNNSFAQSYGKLITAPVSPNAAALGEYGNTPISLANGTPNIAIPLFEIKGKQLSVPISLSYRASGIKVDEIGSNIGMGWVLNAGGVISRAVMGLPEEGVDDTGIYPRRPNSLPFPVGQLFTSSNSQSLLTVINGVRNLNWDTSPDLFFYNFQGYSGKFAFDPNGTPKIAPDLDFKIEYSWPSGQIKITDGNGIKYFFHWQESINYQNGPTTTTAWYLTKIVSTDGFEIIDFDYEYELYSYPRTLRETRYLGGVNETTFENWSSDQVWTEVGNGGKLRSIKTNFGYNVDFLPGRNDYVVTSIGGIAIYYGDDRIKSFEFDQEIISTESVPSTFPESSTAQRIYLKSITSRNKNLIKDGAYEFTYYGRNNGKDMLPHRVSYAVDHWGYYNGKISNTTLRPSFEGYFPSSNYTNTGGSTYYASLPGADRTPKFPEMQYGTLESITYPTGGSEYFIYQPHDNSGIVIGGLRIKEIKTFDRGNLIRHRTFEYENPSLLGNPKYTSESFVYFQSGQNFKVPPTSTGLPAVRIIDSGSSNAFGATNGSHISYGKVRELEQGNGFRETTYTTAADGNYDGYYETNSNEYARYSFYQAETNLSALHNGGFTWDSDGGWPFVPRIDCSWKRGLLLSTKEFKEGGTMPIRTVSYSYNLPVNGSVFGLTLDQKFYTGAELPLLEIAYGQYRIDFGFSTLKSQVITENGVTRTINNEYLGNLLKKSSEIIGNKLLETYSYYPHSPEFDNTPELGSDLLKATHQLNIPLRTVRKTNEIVTYKSENMFADLSGKIKLIKQFEFANGNNEGKRDIDISYDVNFNLSTIRKGSDSSHRYLWDYNNQLVTAQVISGSIEKISYTSFEAENTGGWSFGVNKNSSDALTGKYSHDVSSSIVNNNLNSGITYKLSYWHKGGTINLSTPIVAGTEISYVNSVNNWIYWEGEIKDITSLTISKGAGTTVLIDELRLCPVESQITTYTYEPGVGMTSMTDSNNIVTYFEYDSSNRLQAVKDKKNNILKAKSYHFRSDK